MHEASKAGQTLCRKYTLSDASLLPPINVWLSIPLLRTMFHPVEFCSLIASFTTPHFSQINKIQTCAIQCRTTTYHSNRRFLYEYDLRRTGSKDNLVCHTVQQFATIHRVDKTKQRSSQLRLHSLPRLLDLSVAHGSPGKLAPTVWKLTFGEDPYDCAADLQP